MADAPQWGTLTIEVPDFLESTRQAINSVAEFLVSILDIVLAALQLVKAFLMAFLDPILALLQKIIDELNALIQDIRQMGIYITGDWKLFDYPFDNLLGGYREYERRMLVRMTDRTDPTRPNVSGRMMVFGLFFYLSVDISDIKRLIAFIMRLIAFFKQDWSANCLPSVIITEVKYGLDTISIMNPVSMGDAFKQLANSGISGATPQVAQVVFKTHTPNKNSPFNPFPPNLFGPEGFIITVSTIQEGIKLRYDKPRLNTSTEPSAANPTTMVQPRDYGVVRGTDGRPIVLYGGWDMLNTSPALSYNNNTAAMAPVTGKVRVYGITDPASNTPIDLDKLGDGPYFQKTFYMDQTQVVFQSFTGEYTFNMNLTDMPIEADLSVDGDGKTVFTPVMDQDGFLQKAGTVFVRIAACNKNAINKFKYDFTNSRVLTMGAAPGPLVVPNPSGIDATDIGAWSQPMRVTFPNAYTAMYINAVQSALVVLFLSRPDLVPLAQLKQILTTAQIKKIEAGQLLVEGTANQDCGLESLKHLLRVMYDGAFGPAHQWKRTSESPVEFRLSLIRRVRKFTQDLYERTGPLPDIEKFVAESTVNLRTVTWDAILGASSDLLAPGTIDMDFRNATLLDSIDPDTAAGKNPNFGLAINPWCMGIDNADNLLLRPDLIKGRAPGMFEVQMGDGAYTLRNPVPAAIVDTYLAGLPPAVKAVYESSPRDTQKNIVVPNDQYKNLLAQQTGHKEGSGDHSPVVFNSRSTIVDGGGSVAFARTLLGSYQDRVLITEANIALSMAGSLWKRSDDGAWIAIRFFDIFPGIDDFLKTIRDWIEAIKKFLQSIIDTILKYIAWLEARIIEMQQLIRRINALIQSLLNFLFQVPACSALMCISPGTGGLVSDFMGSQFKPDDSPLAYGAGVALVVPFLPSFLYQLLLMIFKKKDGRPGDGESLAGIDPPSGIPLEGLPEPPPPGEDQPPDTL